MIPPSPAYSRLGSPAARASPVTRGTRWEPSLDRTPFHGTRTLTRTGAVRHADCAQLCGAAGDGRTRGKLPQTWWGGYASPMPTGARQKIHLVFSPMLRQEVALNETNYLTTCCICSLWPSMTSHRINFLFV